MYFSHLSKNIQGYYYNESNVYFLGSHLIFLHTKSEGDILHVPVSQLDNIFSKCKVILLISLLSLSIKKTIAFSQPFFTWVSTGV